MKFEEKIGIARSTIKTKNHNGTETTSLKVKFPDELVCEVNILESMQKMNWEQIIEHNGRATRIKCVKITTDYEYPEFLLMEIILADPLEL